MPFNQRTQSPAEMLKIVQSNIDVNRRLEKINASVISSIREQVMLIMKNGMTEGILEILSGSTYGDTGDDTWFDASNPLGGRDFPFYDTNSPPRRGQFIEHAVFGSRPNSNPFADFLFSEGRAKAASDKLMERFGNSITAGVELKAITNKTYNLHIGKQTVQQRYNIDQKTHMTKDAGALNVAKFKIFQKMNNLLLISTMFRTLSNGNKRWMVTAADIYSQLREDIINQYLSVDAISVKVTEHTLEDGKIVSELQITYNFKKLADAFISIARSLEKMYREHSNLWEDATSRRDFFRELSKMAPPGTSVGGT